jgi:endonuclease/exonuclease/phosphatase (EEP) superfamily protein YafD
LSYITPMKNTTNTLSLNGFTRILGALSVLFALSTFSHEGLAREKAFSVPADEDVLYTIGQATHSQLPAEKFKFMVWNLFKGSEETFEKEFVAMAITRHIILAQEMLLDKKMLDTFRLLPHYKFTTATSFYSGKKKLRTGVANISPVKPLFTEYIRTKNLEPFLKTPKMALITTYPIAFSRKNLTVVNIHGINFVTTKKFGEEMERIYQVIKDIPHPLVFSGDFNTWNDDRLKILENYTKKLGLKEAEFYPDHRIRFNGNVLDHFLHSPDLKVTSAEVHDSYIGSDHRPLLVDVEYSPEKEDQITFFESLENLKIP